MGLGAWVWEAGGVDPSGSRGRKCSTFLPLNGAGGVHIFSRPWLLGRPPRGAPLSTRSTCSAAALLPQPPSVALSPRQRPQLTPQETVCPGQTVPEGGVMAASTVPAGPFPRGDLWGPSEGDRCKACRRAQSEHSGVPSSSSAPALCDLGQVPSPLWASFFFDGFGFKLENWFGSGYSNGQPRSVSEFSLSGLKPGFCTTSLLFTYKTI